MDNFDNDDNSKYASKMYLNSAPCEKYQLIHWLPRSHALFIGTLFIHELT